MIFFVPRGCVIFFSGEVAFLEQENRFCNNILSSCSSCSVSVLVTPYQTSEFDRTLEMSRAFLKNLIHGGEIQHENFCMKSVEKRAKGRKRIF